MDLVDEALLEVCLDAWRTDAATSSRAREMQTLRDKCTQLQTDPMSRAQETRDVDDSPSDNREALMALRAARAQLAQAEAERDLEKAEREAAEEERCFWSHATAQNDRQNGYGEQDREITILRQDLARESFKRQAAERLVEEAAEARQTGDHASAQGARRLPLVDQNQFEMMYEVVALRSELDEERSQREASASHNRGLKERNEQLQRMLDTEQESLFEASLKGLHHQEMVPASPRVAPPTINSDTEARREREQWKAQLNAERVRWAAEVRQERDEAHAEVAAARARLANVTRHLESHPGPWQSSVHRASVEVPQKPRRNSVAGQLEKRCNGSAYAAMDVGGRSLSQQRFDGSATKALVESLQIEIPHFERVATPRGRLPPPLAVDFEPLATSWSQVIKVGHSEESGVKMTGLGDAASDSSAGLAEWRPRSKSPFHGSALDLNHLDRLKGPRNARSALFSAGDDLASPLSAGLLQDPSDSPGGRNASLSMLSEVSFLEGRLTEQDAITSCLAIGAAAPLVANAGLLVSRPRKPPWSPSRKTRA